MNFVLLKKAAILSVITGCVLGLITLIPYINILSFLILLFLTAPALIIYMKINNMIGIVDTKEGAIWSAIIGSIASCGFFVIFAPLAALIGVFYHNGVYVGIKILFSTGGIFLVFILYFLLVCPLIGLFNAFTGTLAAYLYQQQKLISKEENQSFQIDNKG